MSPDSDDVGPEASPDTSGFGSDWFSRQGSWFEPVRLPPFFAARTVTFRIPYCMPGELVVGPNRQGVVFPEATFLHSLDKPFEVHRFSVRLTAMSGADAASATPHLQQPDTLLRRVRFRISDFSKNENVTKSSSLVSQLLSNNSGFWEFHDPYVLVRSEGFQVQIETLDFPTICGPDPDDGCQLTSLPTTFVRVEAAFLGYLIIVQPPSAKR